MRVREKEAEKWWARANLDRMPVKVERLAPKPCSDLYERTISAAARTWSTLRHLCHLSATYTHDVTLHILQTRRGASGPLAL